MRYLISFNKFLSSLDQLERSLLLVNKNSCWYMKGEQQ